MSEQKQYLRAENVAAMFGLKLQMIKWYVAHGSMLQGIINEQGEYFVTIDSLLAYFEECLKGLNRIKEAPSNVSED